MANDTAIKQQHRHLEPELPRELGVGVDVNDSDGGDALRAFELGETLEHVLAKTAALAAQNHEARG